MKELVQIERPGPTWIKKKDPLRPKRGKSPFIHFTLKVREEVVNNLPKGTKITEISKEMGRRWNKLSDNERKPYIKLSTEDKERYVSEKETYKPPEVPTWIKRRKKRSNKLVGGASSVKRPRSAYIMFAKSIRSTILNKNVNMKQTDVVKEIAKRWKTISESDKAVYVAQAESDKIRYNNEKNNQTSETSD